MFDSERLNLIFEERKEEMNPTEFQNLMMDVMNHSLAEDLTEREAEESIRAFMLDVFELTPETINRPRVYRKNFEAHQEEFFELVETVIELKIEDSLQGHPLIQRFAEYRNLNMGDKNEFWIDDKTTLSVARVSGDHHDLTLQYFKKGSKFSVTMNRYAIKVGDDIRQYLLGRKSFSAAIAAVADAFAEKMAVDIVAEIVGIGAKLPANEDLNVAVTMPATGNSVTNDVVRDAIIDVIEKVKGVNGASDIVLMGTRTAIAKLERIQDLDWLSNDAKNEKYHTGRIAYFDEASLYEVPQRYQRVSETLKKLIPDDFLLVIPTAAEKFIKVVDNGDVFAKTRMEVADYMDDLATYEYQKTTGIAAILGQYIGYVKFQ